MTAAQRPRLLPTGNCWCGCGEEVAVGAFFARGHDKVAEAALLAAKYDGSVAELLRGHGYDADRSVTADAIEFGSWEKCLSQDCTYAGAPSSVRNHRMRAGH